VEELGVSQQVSDSKYGANFETRRLLLKVRGEAETLVEAVEHITANLSLATLKAFSCGLTPLQQWPTYAFFLLRLQAT